MNIKTNLNCTAMHLFKFKDLLSKVLLLAAHLPEKWSHKGIGYKGKEVHYIADKYLTINKPSLWVPLRIKLYSTCDINQRLSEVFNLGSWRQPTWDDYSKLRSENCAFWYAASANCGLFVNFLLPPGESGGEESWGTHARTEPQHRADGAQRTSTVWKLHSLIKLLDLPVFLTVNKRTVLPLKRNAPGSSFHLRFRDKIHVRGIFWLGF